MTGIAITPVIAAHVFSGVLLWSWVRRNSSLTWVEALGMGAALGTLLGLGFGLLVGPWGSLVPAGAALAVLVLHLRGRVELAHIQRSGERFGWIAWLPASLAGLVLLVPSLLRTPILNGYLVGDRYHGDLVFLEAVGQSVVSWGWQDNLLLAGEPLRYHWFVYAWSSIVTDVAGAEAFVVLTRATAVLLVFAAAWLAAAWARRLGATPVFAGVASLLVVAGGYVGAQQGTLLPYDSPSAGYGTVLILAISLAISEYMRGQVSHRALVVIGLLAVGLVGAKVTTAIVLAAGVAFLVLGSLVHPATINRGRALLVAVTAGVGSLGAYLTFLAGVDGGDAQVQFGFAKDHASTFQGLDPFAGPAGVLLGTSALVLAVLPRVIGWVWLTADRSWRLGPDLWMTGGMGIVGLGTLYVLSSGTNSAWFVLAASAPLAIVSALGLQCAINSTDRRVSPVRLAIPIGLAAMAVSFVVYMNFGLQAVTDAPVGWRSPVAAWLTASMLAVLVAVVSWKALNWRTWAVAVTGIVMTSAVLARVAGPVLWDITSSTTAPYFRTLVSAFDPEAEFVSQSIQIGRIKEVVGLRAASSGVPIVNQDEENAYYMNQLQWTPLLNEAAQDLKLVSNQADVVALDNPYLQPYPALVSGLRSLASNVQITSNYTTADGVQSIASRIDLTRTFVDSPTSATAEALRELGVRWVWIQTDPAAFAARNSDEFAIALSNAEVVVVDISDSGASSS